MFQQPAAGGDKVPFGELIGALVLIYVREYRTGITTVHGQKDAVACDLHVLDGPKAGAEYENSMVFQAALVGSLKTAAGGEPVLGRVAQGVAKPGQNPPFILVAFTEADAAIGRAWIQARASQFQPPAAAPAPAAAAPAPVATAPAAAAPAASAPAAPAAVDYSSLPPEVVELLRQSGQLPAGV